MKPVWQVTRAKATSTAHSARTRARPPPTRLNEGVGVQIRVRYRGILIDRRIRAPGLVLRSPKMSVAPGQVKAEQSHFALVGTKRFLNWPRQAGQVRHGSLWVSFLLLWAMDTSWSATLGPARASQAWENGRKGRSRPRHQEPVRSNTFHHSCPELFNDIVSILPLEHHALVSLSRDNRQLSCSLVITSTTTTDTSRRCCPLRPIRRVTSTTFDCRATSH